MLIIGIALMLLLIWRVLGKRRMLVPNPTSSRPSPLSSERLQEPGENPVGTPPASSPLSTAEHRETPPPSPAFSSAEHRETPLVSRPCSVRNCHCELPHVAPLTEEDVDTLRSYIGNWQVHDEAASVNFSAWEEAVRRLQDLYEHRPPYRVVVRDPVNAENDRLATVTAVDTERGRVEVGSVNEAPRFRWAHETGRQARDRMRSPGAGYYTAFVGGSSNYQGRVLDPTPQTPWFREYVGQPTQVSLAVAKQHYKAFIAMWGKVAEAHEKRVFMKDGDDLQATNQVA